MLYTVYKITNRINNKIYIGKHQTKNLDDGYLGSGKVLKRAIEKYGIENFDKEILYIFEEKKDMDEMEKEIVSEEFVSRKDTYNLKVGGEGGWDYINSDPNIHGKRDVLAKINSLKKPIMWKDEDFRKRFIDRMKQLHSEGRYKHTYDYVLNGFLNKKHSEESKKKIGAATSITQKGEGNSQFGTCWICHDELREAKKIKKDDLQKWILQGWRKGRKLK